MVLFGVFAGFAGGIRAKPLNFDFGSGARFLDENKHFSGPTRVWCGKISFFFFWRRCGKINDPYGLGPFGAAAK